MAKKINEILKSLNFPKFYDKSYEEDGSPYYCFDNFAVREYTNEDNKLFLDNLPFTEDTIHQDDVEFIIQFLEYMIACNQKDEVVSYIFKLMDNMPLGEPEENHQKTLIILRAPQFKKIGKEIFGVVDEKPYGDFKKKSKKNHKKIEEVQEKLLKPIVGMMETLAGAMLDSIEKKEKKEDGEYIFNHTDKGIKIEKTSPKTIVKSSYRKELKNLIKETKYSLKSLNKNDKSEFGESKKKLKKNLKKWKKELKKSKK